MNIKRFINNINLTVSTIENLPLFFADYFGFVHSDVLYKIKNKKIKFVARGGTTDKEEIVVIMSGYEYNFSKLPKLKSPTIFDVGAYIGDFAVYANVYFNGKARIISFEPDAENFKYCQVNLLLNDVKAEAFNMALSNKNGKGFLKTKNIPADSFSLETGKVKSTNCDIVTLQSISKKLNVTNIDILKFDIEGGEYTIFEHSESFNFIKRNVKYLILEYHNLKDAEWKMQWLIDKTANNFKTIFEQNNLLYLENKLNEK